MYDALIREDHKLKVIELGQGHDSAAGQEI